MKSFVYILIYFSLVLYGCDDESSPNSETSLLDQDTEAMDQGTEVMDQGTEVMDQSVSTDAIVTDMNLSEDMEFSDMALCPMPTIEIEDALDNDCDGRVDEDFILSTDWITLESGSFMMGNATVDGESPVHEVNITSFQMMRTEITVAQYRRCVDAGACTSPLTGDFLTWSDTHENDNLALNGVSWSQIQEFAQWVALDWPGARLPTEAEWEYAARSQGEDNIYPWGNDEPSCTLAQYRGTDDDFCSLDTGVGGVCSTPSGNTTQGLCDMAGNLYEWVLDEWHENYLSAPNDGSAWCSTSDCINPDANRVVRGGAWSSSAQYITVTRRGMNMTSEQTTSVGARLVRLID